MSISLSNNNMSTSNNNRKIILVTGANRGIGKAIVTLLAQNPQLPHTSTIILLGCRNFDAGVRTCHDLRSHNIRNVEPIQLDVTSDASIRDAIGKIEYTYNQLDILINNAGYAVVPSTSPTTEETPDLRKIYRDTYNVNVVSVASLCQHSLPLLRQSPHGGKVIQVGSKRGSLQLNAAGAMPPTASMAYTVSKAALNMLTLDMARDPANAGVEFQIANPGHCKTAFNGYRGLRDPEEGANVVVELVVGKRRETRVWETIEANKELVAIPW